MDLASFRSKQDEIYDVIRRLEAEKTLVSGIEADPRLAARCGGFYLSLIHAPAIAEQASVLSMRIGDLVPAIAYRPQDLHTTAGSLMGPDPQEHFYFDKESAEHQRTLAQVTTIAQTVAERVRRDTCEIRFEEPIVITPHSVVAPGEPNAAFVDLANLVVSMSTGLQAALTPPWGAHMTISRFAASRTPEQLQDLFRLKHAAPCLGLSRPIGIAAGYVLRHPSERYVEDLRLTPGPFHTAAFFPFT